MDRRTSTISLLAVGALTLASACSSGGGSASPADTPDSTPATAADGDWQDQITEVCDAFVSDSAGIPEPDGSPASLGAYAAALRQVGTDGPSLADVDFPPEAQPTLDHVIALGDANTAALDRADAAAAAGDAAGAKHALDEWNDGLHQMGAAFALAGARCGTSEPARLDGAQLNVPLSGDPAQLATGYGSIWVSENLAGQVVRVDPDDGKVIATIDVGVGPGKLQPADGRMIVRTLGAYVAINPETNAVVGTLAKADVGPAANRAWAVDGALWICDGRRLHRYDPATFTPTAVLDLDVDCGQVYATDDLVVAWNYNEDPGPSGTSAATFVDPVGDRPAGTAPTPTSSPRVLATTPLPVDVGVPVVLPDSVFFHAQVDASTAVVVQRGTWTVTATPDLGRPTTGSNTGYDGRSIYVITDDYKDILVTDAETFEVTDTIETFGVNSVDLHDGALWVTSGDSDVLQRFDR
jgi:hypothetical protein